MKPTRSAALFVACAFVAVAACGDDTFEEVPSSSSGGGEIDATTSSSSSGVGGSSGLLADGGDASNDGEAGASAGVPGQIDPDFGVIPLNMAGAVLVQTTPGTLTVAGLTSPLSYASDHSLMSTFFLDGSLVDPDASPWNYMPGYPLAAAPIANGAYFSGITDGFGPIRHAFVKRTREFGVTDPAFAAPAFSSIVGCERGSHMSGVFVQTDGSPVAVGACANTSDQVYPTLIRFDAEGALTGFWQDAQAQSSAVRAVAEGSHAIALLNASATTDAGAIAAIRLARFDLSTPDAGVDGTFVSELWTGNGFAQYGADLVEVGGAYYAAGTTYVDTGVGRGFVRKYSVSGALDTSFADQGTLLLDFGQPGASATLSRIVDVGNGRLVVGGSSGTRAVLARFDITGQLDPTFADGGVLLIEPRDERAEGVMDVLLAPGGGALYVGEHADHWLGRLLKVWL